MDKESAVVLVILVVWWTGCTEALKCYSCSNIGNISECLTVARCTADEECFTESTGLGQNAVFTLGCKTYAQCQGLTTQSPMSIVGRHIDPRVASTGCSQCCAVDYCNEHICNQATGIVTNTDGQCQDDADYNCQLVSGLFNVCGDIHHAKLVCRKWCGLCNLVDGGWSDWTAWSQCDISCGQGQTLRNRTCTEPTPSHGGLDCIGSNMDMSNCTLDACPVNGAWSGWSSWGSCSVTCGVGLQRRDRSCSNPYPGLYGNPCVGDSRDDHVCFLRACSDGGWSDWTPWGSCSVTCGCGLMSRSRKCDNPKTSLLGQPCEGNNEDKSLCNTPVCPVPVVVFSVTTPSSELIGGDMNSGNPKFTKVETNIGNCYNQTSGEFVCRVAGIYHFSLIILAKGGPTECSIHQNRVIKAEAHAESSSVNWATGSASIYLTLAFGDIVTLYCHGWSFENHSEFTMFNGELTALV